MQNKDYIDNTCPPSFCYFFISVEILSTWWVSWTYHRVCLFPTFFSTRTQTTCWKRIESMGWKGERI